MIKKIHYCWFGGKLPANVAENVKRWQLINPDFEICEWNASNSDVSEYEFGLRAIRQKRWAFVSDIVRLQKLYEHGGIYLDTDVELIRPFTALEGESRYLVMGYMYDYCLGTAAIHCPPGHPVIARMLEEYHRIADGMWPVNNIVFTDYFLNHVPGFLLNGRRWINEVENISLHPKEFFEQPAFVRENGISIHHYSGSWMPENAGRVYHTASTQGRSHKLKWLKRQLRTALPLSLGEYWGIYWKARLGLPSHRKSPWKGPVGG